MRRRGGNARATGWRGEGESGAERNTMGVAKRGKGGRGCRAMGVSNG